MDFKPEMLDWIVCPQCGGRLHYTKEKVLFCIKCRLCFPVTDGVADLVLENSFPLGGDGKPILKEKAAFISVVEGKDSGVHFRLTPMTCKAVGRKLEDAVKTQVFNIDFTMTLDDHTKNVVANYLSKTSPKKKKVWSKETDKSLGTYKRLPDLVLDDPGISRLHAMFFYNEEGVGILDLVSKNGTFVNDREVESYFLKAGDCIRLGNTKMMFALK